MTTKRHTADIPPQESCGPRKNEHESDCKFALLLSQGNHQALVDALLNESVHDTGLSLAALLIGKDADVPSINPGGRPDILVTDNPKDLDHIDNLVFVIDPENREGTSGGLPQTITDRIIHVNEPFMQSWIKIINRQDLIMKNHEQESRMARDKAELYQAMFDNALVGMYRTAINDGALIVGNRKLADILKYPTYQEFLNQHNAIHNYADPVNRKVLFMMLEKQGTVDEFEVQIKRRDGSVFWACISARFFPEKGYLEGMILDIDTRKKAEEENKYLTQRLLDAQEKERRRIVQNLHDDIGQALSSLQFDMDRLKNTFPAHYAKQQYFCNKIMTDIENIGNITRRMSFNLRPDVLDDLGLVAALKSLVKAFGRPNSDLQIDLQIMGYKKRLNLDIETILFRSAQEALNNIRKHAGASYVKIILTFSFPDVIMTIRDNGCGFEQNPDQASRSQGIGLLGMRERIESVGGVLTILSAPGKGTLIRAKINANQLE